MGSLTLRLEKQTLSEILDRGAVAQVRQIADDTGEYPLEPFEKLVTIAAGRGNGTVIDVPEGQYRIDLRMPGGRVLNQSASVTPSDSVVFDAGRSPAESLSWQSLAGNIADAATYSVQKASDTLSGAGVKLDLTTFVLPDLFDLKRLDGLENLGLEQLSTGTPARPVRRRAKALSPLPAPPPTVATSLSVGTMQAGWRVSGVQSDHQPAPQFADGVTSLWHLADAAPSTDVLRTGVGENRRLAYARIGQCVQLAFLPVPWSDMGVAVEIIYNPRQNEMMRVSVRDPEFAAILNYFGAARLAEAAAVVDDKAPEGWFRDALADKVKCPLGACAAGYIGIATTAPADRAIWAPWLDNLAAWFPAIPDGFVLSATHKLQSAQSIDDLKAACLVFKRAYRAGIPYYAAGVQQLASGLFYFSEAGDGPETSAIFDDEAAEMYRSVARIAAKVDGTQAFTVLTVSPGELDNV